MSHFICLCLSEGPPPDTTLTVNSANISNHRGLPISEIMQNSLEGLGDHMQNSNGFLIRIFLLLLYML